MKRRKFIKNTIVGGLTLGLASGVYSWKIEPFWLEFVKIKMPIANLPDELVGKTLMQISDLHIGNRFDYQYIIDSLVKAQKFNPDFVVYTGDYVSYEDDKQFKQLDEVLKYFVKGKFGTVGILGNHDYGRNWAVQKIANTITEQLEQEGIQILSNDQLQLNGLNFIGFDDYWSPNFAPQNVMKQ